jgi:hypothetical protein
LLCPNTPPPPSAAGAGASALLLPTTPVPDPLSPQTPKVFGGLASPGSNPLAVVS